MIKIQYSNSKISQVMKTILISILLLFCLHLQAQTTLLGTEPFNTDFLVHGTTASSTVWFAPNYYTPIDWQSTGGCTDGRIGYSGSWNNYWGNFVRLPEINCTGFDTIQLEFDVSHSWFASHPNDWCRFYMWADAGYVKNVITVVIDSTDVTYDSGMNGKGFKFTEVRTCAHVVVTFDISLISNKSNILLYIEPSCGYNNSNVFNFWIDNVNVSSSPTTVSLKENENQILLNIYPSIADNEIVVNFTEQIETDYLILLYTSEGRMLDKIKPQQEENSVVIDISHLSSGMYFLSIQTDENSIINTSRFVKF